jgi:pyruvate dehydrogenase E1 component
LAGPLFGTRLLPIGTLYDPFIERRRDELNYACHQDGRASRPKAALTNRSASR